MSSLTTLARPYAKAAFDVAHGQEALATWEQALHLAASIAADDSVQGIISDPTVLDTELAAVFAAHGESPEGYESMIALLTENNRLPLLPDIAILFSTLKDEAEKTLAVTVRSASELDETYRAKLAKALAERFGKQVELSVEIDPDVLGGAIIEAGDLVIDGSVRGKLDRMSAAMHGR